MEPLFYKVLKSNKCKKLWHDENPTRVIASNSPFDKIEEKLYTFIKMPDFLHKFKDRGFPKYRRTLKSGSDRCNQCFIRERHHYHQCPDDDWCFESKPDLYDTDDDYEYELVTRVSSLTFNSE